MGVPATLSMQPWWVNCPTEWAIGAASLPQAPSAVIAQVHTQHMGQDGNDGLVELLMWS